MKTSDARKLEINDRVQWSDDGVLGTVVDKNWHAVMIKWDDGVECICQLKHNESQWKGMVRITARSGPH